MARVALRIILTLVVTIVLALAALGLMNYFAGTGDVAAFADSAPRALFGLMGIALALWAVLLIIGAIVHRRRRVGWRIGTHVVSLFVAIVVNLAVFAVIAFTATGVGGWSMLILAIGAATGAVLMIAGTIAVVVVEVALRTRVSAAGQSGQSSEH